MWLILRRDFAAAQFRRQVPLAGGIADFASHRARLVIECDGGQHGAGDAARDAAIVREGYRVLRLWNHDVLGNADGAAREIARVLAELSPQSNLR